MAMRDSPGGVVWHLGATVEAVTGLGFKVALCLGGCARDAEDVHGGSSTIEA